MHVRISAALEEPAWDRFLQGRPDGHHVQGTQWARVRGGDGWQTIRVLVLEGSELVGGAQILVQPATAGLRLGHVPRGPLFRSYTEPATRMLLSALEDVRRRHRLSGLVVQPPEGAKRLVELLRAGGFLPSPLSISLPATTQLDLQVPEDDIRARMSKSHRRSLRHALQSGLVTRWGNAQDLPAFYGLYLASSRRQSFRPHSPAFFERLWALFTVDDSIRLLLVESGNVPVAGHLVVSFGERAVAKYGGWTGTHAKERPNHLMDWTTIQWARAAGYRWYDLEGITREEAQAALQGRRQELGSGTGTYKLDWGGQVVEFPPAYVRIANPLLRTAFLRGMPAIEQSAALGRFKDWIRSRRRV